MTEPGAGVPSADEPQVDVLGQLSVELDAEYMLRPSRQAISNVERATGKPLIQLAAQASSLTLGVEEMGICVAELMRAYAAFDPNAAASYRNAKPERCADLIYEKGGAAVSNRLAPIFRQALTGGYTASGEVKAAGTKTMTEPTPTAD